MIAQRSRLRGDNRIFRQKTASLCQQIGLPCGIFGTFTLTHNQPLAWRYTTAVYILGIEVVNALGLEVHHSLLYPGYRSA